MIFDCSVWFSKIMKRSNSNFSQSFSLSFYGPTHHLSVSFIFLSQSGLSSLLDQQSRWHVSRPNRFNPTRGPAPLPLFHSRGQSGAPISSILRLRSTPSRTRAPTPTQLSCVVIRTSAVCLHSVPPSWPSCPRVSGHLPCAACLARLYTLVHCTGAHPRSSHLAPVCSPYLPGRRTRLPPVPLCMSEVHSALPLHMLSSPVTASQPSYVPAFPFPCTT
jgi:hypothetical protein